MKSVLFVESRHTAIGKQTDERRGFSMSVDVFHQRVHDHAANSPPLMLRQNCDINDVVKKAAVADDTSKTHNLVRVFDANGVERVRQTLASPRFLISSGGRQHYERDRIPRRLAHARRLGMAYSNLTDDLISPILE